MVGNLRVQANLTIEDILIKNMYGTTSESLDPQAGTLICSAPDRCDSIRAENITVQVPSGEAPVYACKNVDKDLLRFNCTEPAGERDLGQG